MSQVKLNLGCGVFPFPYEHGTEPNPEHILPLPDICYEPGWINIDKHAGAGIDEQINLFRFPWIRSSNGNPFNDNSADAIWAAHLVEHVPHEVKINRNAIALNPWLDWVENFDGFFVFFAEAWRILKPGGLFYVRVPYAACYPALSDPTHTRYITPGTFSYLAGRNEDTPFDYDIPCRYELAEPYMARMVGDWNEKSKDFTADGFSRLIQNNYSVVDEIRITLRALK